MTIYSADAEGYADGAAVTAANTGSGTAFDGIVSSGTGAITATATVPLKESTSYLFTPDNTTPTALTVYWLLTASNTFAFRCKLRLTGYPSVTTQLIRFTNASGSTGYASINVSATGALVITDSASTTAFTSGSTVFALNTTYRVEGSLSNGTNTTDVLVVKVYPDDSTTEIAAMGTTSTGAFGAVQPGRINLGKISPTPTMAPFRLDDVQVTTGTTTLPGPSTNRTLVASLALSAASGVLTAGVASVTATAGSKYGTGTAKTLTLDWGDGSTTGPQSGMSATHSYVAVGTYTIGASVLNT